MELAFILILLVIAELVLTVFMVSRHRQYLKEVRDMKGRVKRLESNTRKIAEVIRDSNYAEDVNLEGYEVDTLSDLVSKATPDDIAKAQEILAQMGMGN